MDVEGAEGRGKRIKKLSAAALAELEQEQDRKLKRAAAAWKSKIKSSEEAAEAESKGVPYLVFQAKVAQAELAKQGVDPRQLKALKMAYENVQANFDGINERFSLAERSGMPIGAFLEKEGSEMGLTPMQFGRIFGEIMRDREGGGGGDGWGGEEDKNVAELVDLVAGMTGGGRRRRRRTRRRRQHRRKTQRNPKRKRA